VFDLAATLDRESSASSTHGSHRANTRRQLEIDAESG